MAREGQWKHSKAKQSTEEEDSKAGHSTAEQSKAKDSKAKDSKAEHSAAKRFHDADHDASIEEQEDLRIGIAAPRFQERLQAIAQLQMAADREKDASKRDKLRQGAGGKKTSTITSTTTTSFMTLCLSNDLADYTNPLALIKRARTEYEAAVPAHATILTPEADAFRTLVRQLPPEDVQVMSEVAHAFGPDAMEAVDATDLATFRESVQRMRILLTVKRMHEGPGGRVLGFRDVVELLKGKMEVGERAAGVGGFKVA